MRTKAAADWERSASLPDRPVSFTGVSYGEMLERARALVPAIAARAGENSTTAMFLTIGSYIDTNKNYFEKGGSCDKEIARRTVEAAEAT